MEQPESYQHTIVRVVLTQRFATLVEKGVRIIITTQGDWPIGAAAAIVLRSEVPETEQRDAAAPCPDLFGV